MEDSKDYNYIKYEGPAVDDYSMDAQKLGKAILGMNSAFKKYCSREKKWTDLKPVLRVNTEPGSLTVAACIAATAYAADKLGLTELTRGYFGELGKQIALKQFARGKELRKEGQPQIEDGKMYFSVINVNGDHNRVDAETFNRARDFEKAMEAIIEPAEPKQIDRIRYGYKISGSQSEEIIVDAAEKEYFETTEPTIPEEDLEEDFDDALAEEIPPIIGKLVAYQALATKYPFEFQPREKQDVYGKKFIPCMLEDENKRDDYIELMKSYIGNVVIRGLGIKDEGGKYRKIKIVSLEKNENPSLFE